jgi:hypothetical protein
MSLCRPRIRRCTLVVIGATLVIFAVTVVGMYLGLHSNDEAAECSLNPPDPTSPIPPSDSELGIYWNAAVATNGYPCAIIGRLVVLRNEVNITI